MVGREKGPTKVAIRHRLGVRCLAQEVANRLPDISNGAIGDQAGSILVSLIVDALKLASVLDGEGRLICQRLGEPQIRLGELPVADDADSEATHDAAA